MMLTIQRVLISAFFTLTLAGCGTQTESSASETSASVLPLVSKIDLGKVLPDLVITQITTGALRITPTNKILPFSITVKNQTFIKASGFKVSVAFTPATGGEYAVAFNVPGQSDLWYPRATGLNGNGTISFSGTLLFRRDLTGPVTIKALADSCSGEELSLEYCHVKEGREDNNLSAPVTVSL